MKYFTSEQLKDELWKKGIQISYQDLRVFLKYLIKRKDKGHFIVTYDDYERLLKFLNEVVELPNDNKFHDRILREGVLNYSNDES